MNNVLVGLTGSVATVVGPKLVHELCKSFDHVQVIMTERAKAFTDASALRLAGAEQVWTDWNEWHFGDGESRVNCPTWTKNDPVRHIELRRWADAMVVAPISATTIAKYVYGIADNLLTSVMLAWDTCRPLVIAPAMNTYMLEAAQTQRNLDLLRSMESVSVVPTQMKMLACGEEGDGAMANIDVIVRTLRERMRWLFPIMNCKGIPVDDHGGAFGVHRKEGHHCGVDLYTERGETVYAVERGRIVEICDFTGPSAGYDQWLDTKAVKVEGASGVICYGEIIPARGLTVGQKVHRGTIIGCVTPVIKMGDERPDVEGHSRSMLHFQMYRRETLHKDHEWLRDGPRPENLLDPTQQLMDAENAPSRRFSFKRNG